MKRTKRKVIHRVVSEDFARLLDEIKKTRVLQGIDDIKNMKPDWRLTLAIIRHPNFNLIKQDIIMADLE